MIRLIRAFAWLRWRLIMNTQRGRRRDGVEQVSRATRLLVAAIVAATLIPGSIVLAFLAFAGGRGLAAGDPRAMALTTGARGVLAVVTIVVAIGPMLRFGGAASSMTRLALLPVPRRFLFAAEWVAHLADPWMLAVAPALVALPAGLLAGGAPVAASVVAAAGALVLAMLSSLGCAASLLSALLFRRRRVGEIASIAVLLGITIVAYLPMLASHGTLFKGPRAMSEAQGDAVRRALDFDASQSRWAGAAPWELYARSIEHAVPPERSVPLRQLSALAGGVLGLAGAAFWAFGRLQDAPGERSRRGKPGEDRVRHVPGLSPAASAIARTTLRLLTRSVRGRVILMTAPLPALLFAIVWRGKSMGPLGTSHTGLLVVGVAGLLALMSVTTFLSDQFAVDRAGLTLTFLSPVSATEIVAGKAFGTAAAFAIPLAVGTVAAVILHPQGSPLLWAGTLMCVLAAFLAQSPAAAALAALFPAPFDLSRLKGGNPHPLASILATLTAMTAYAICGGIFAGTLALSRSAVAAFAAALFVLAAAAVFAGLTWPLAARLLDARRENLAMTAQGR